MRGKTSEGNHVALTKCFYCGEDNQILLHRRLGDVSHLHGKVVNLEPCTKCQDYMRQGIILIGIDPDKSPPNWWKSQETPPWRTGHFVVIREEALMRIIADEDLARGIRERRWTFCDCDVMRKTVITQPLNAAGAKQ